MSYKKEGEKKRPEKETLPAGVVKLDGKGGFTITLARVRQNTLHDQASVTADGIGCFNNPGGPTC